MAITSSAPIILLAFLITIPIFLYNLLAWVGVNDDLFRSHDCRVCTILGTILTFCIARLETKSEAPNAFKKDGLEIRNLAVKLDRKVQAVGDLRGPIPLASGQKAEVVSTLHTPPASLQDSKSLQHYVEMD